MPPSPRFSVLVVRLLACRLAVLRDAAVICAFGILTEVTVDPLKAPVREMLLTVIDSTAKLLAAIVEA